MSVVIIGGGPPTVTPLATPVLLTVPVANFGQPWWVGAPLGTWYARCVVADSDPTGTGEQPLTIAAMSPLSNEISFTITGTNDFVFNPTWTVDGSWPASAKMLFFLSQTAGDYFGAIAVVPSSDATQHAVGAIGPMSLASAGAGPFALGVPAGISLRPQNFLADLVSDFQVDSDSVASEWTVSGGTLGDPILTPQVKAAIRAIKADDIDELTPTGLSPFDWLGNVDLVRRGVDFVGGVWQMNDEDFYCAGSFRVTYPANLLVGTKLADGSRVNGATIGYVPLSTAQPEPDWTGNYSLYAAAILDLSSRLGAAVPGVAGPGNDPANDWVNGIPPAAPAHDRATSANPNTSGIRFIPDVALIPETFEMGAVRFNNQPLVQWQFLQAGFTLDLDSVGMHGVGEFRMDPGGRFVGLVMEQCRRGFEVNASNKPDSVLVGCRVTGYSECAINFESAFNQGLVLVDFTSDEDADSDDPMVRLRGWLGTSHLSIAHRVDVQVIDYLGAGVNGATVTLLKDDSVIFSETTAGAGDDAGKVPQQEVVRYRYEVGPNLPAEAVDLMSGHLANGFVVLAQQPKYTLVVERAGFETEVLQLEVDQQLALVVTNHSTKATDFGVVMGDDAVLEASVGPLVINATVDDATVDATIEPFDVEADV